VGLLALFSTEYAPTERGTILTVARLTPKGPLSGYAPGKSCVFKYDQRIGKSGHCLLVAGGVLSPGLAPRPTLRGWR
jgi:hypothetical protein